MAAAFVTPAPGRSAEHFRSKFLAISNIDSSPGLFTSPRWPQNWADERVAVCLAAISGGIAVRSLRKRSRHQHLRPGTVKTGSSIHWATARERLESTSLRRGLQSALERHRARALLRRASVEEADFKQTPRLSKILLDVVKFLLPAFTLVATNMILTAVDKAFIGHVSSVQLAALGPATAMFDCCSYLLTFINTAILSLVRAAKPGDDAMTVRSHSLAFSFGGGILLSFALLVTAGSAVQLLGASGSLLPYSILYLQIRALGAPVDRIGSATTQFWLAEKDGVTPMLATLLAAVLNVVGDYLLCPRYGVAGAAIATVAASAASAAFLVWRLVARGLWPWPLKLPTLRDFKPFAAFAGPVFLVLLMKIFLFAMMTTGAAQLGMVPLAAHQILVSAFFVGGVSLGQPLSWAAQTFVPGIVGKEKGRTETALLLSASTSAVLAAGVAAFIARGYGVRWFSSDLLVRQGAMAAATPAMLFTALYVIYLTVEGFAIARQRLRACLAISVGVSICGGLAIWGLRARSLLTLGSLWGSQAALLAIGTAAAAIIGTRDGGKA